jgi:hypothetical protein
MAYPLSMSEHTTPVLYCSLLIPKARTFAKVGIADNKNLGFGIPVSGAHMKARDGYDNDGTQGSGHAANAGVEWNLPVGMSPAAMSKASQSI